MADAVQGQQQVTSDGSQFNAISFIVRQLMGQMATATLVQVKSVTNDGGVSPVGMVSVQPMVNQTDGSGIGEPHGIIYNIPYFRLQGGSNAVILDPQIGDIGMAVFASTDLSSVKATGAPANPSSKRRFDWADGLYVGGFLNGTPTQYIQFSSSGVSVVSPGTVTITAPNIVNDASGSFTVNSPSIVLNGPLDQGSGSFAGNASIGGTLTAQVDLVADGVSLVNHLTSGVQSGPDESGPPVPGT